MQPGSHSSAAADVEWRTILCLRIVLVSFNEPAEKGKQMLGEAEHSRNATLDGYFAQEYIRAFEGEAYSDPVRLRRQARLLNKDKNLGKEWIPQSGIKMPSVSRDCKRCI